MFKSLTNASLLQSGNFKYSPDINTSKIIRQTDTETGAIATLQHNWNY